MKIRTIRNTERDYEIRLSTDRTRNLNFIVADPELGFGLFDDLISYFVTGGNDWLDVELDGEGKFNWKFVFVGVDHDYFDLLDYFVERGHTDDLAKIADSANQKFGRMLSEHKSYGSREFLKIKDYQIYVPPRLSAPEASLAYYSLLAAIREEYKINMPLIVDHFGRYGLKYAPLLARLISEAVPQALIFTPEPNFTLSMHNYRTKRRIKSVYDDVRKDIMGSAYRLDKDGVSKYEPRF